MGVSIKMQEHLYNEFERVMAIKGVITYYNSRIDSTLR